MIEVNHVLLCILRVLAAQNEVEEAVAIYVHGLRPP